MKDAMRLFYDTKTKAVVTNVDLATELKALQKRRHEYRNFTLTDHIINRLAISGGTLEEL